MLDGKLLRQFETLKVFWESVTSCSGRGAGKWGEHKNKNKLVLQEKNTAWQVFWGQTKS